MSDAKPFPKFYHGRSPGNCDRAWIASRLAVIPDSARQAVVTQYENIYLSTPRNPRRAANEYLQGVAREYNAQRKKPDANRSKK